ncbi:MAG: TIGR03905 family TSCPD domain-containing protein [Oscillospiraceae bacterium]|nr:TIGR03905 family TSCPD domain-containing protein [Oscillospiraceae bacterium]
MQYEYNAHGVCSRGILIDVEDGIVRSAEFIGGCPGNTSGISKLVAGMKAEDVIARLEGVTCGRKPTSCPDQLAQALKAVLAQEAQN